MICKKCKTATDGNGDKCPYCGAQVKKTRTTGSIMTAFVFVAVVAGCGLYLYFAPAAPADEEIDPERGAAAIASEKPPGVSSEESGRPPEDDGRSEAYAVPDAVFAALSDYLRRHADEPLVESDGFLYNYAKKAYVGMGDLIGDGLLSEEYAGLNPLFLFLNPADLPGFRASAANELFFAYETKDGVLLKSAENEGLIYREDLSRLLNYYKTDDAPAAIYYPSWDSQECREVLAALAQEARMGGGPLVPHYLASDGKHYVCVISEGSRLFGYVLGNTEEDGLKVVIAGFEALPEPMTAVNLAVKGFNFDLMPDFGVYNVPFISRDEDLFFEALRETRMIPENDGLLLCFDDGGGFAYLRYRESGGIIAEKSPETGDRIFYRVTSREEGAAIFRARAAELGVNPPLYLLVID